MNRFEVLLLNSTCAATAWLAWRRLAPAQNADALRRALGRAVQVASIKTRFESALGISA